MRPDLPALFVAALAIGLPAASQGSVLVVDDDGGSGVDFTDLQPAVDAAVDGDTILVRTGSYGGFTIMDEALDVVADTGAVVGVQGSAIVRDLAAGRDVVLRGLTSVDGPATPLDGTWLSLVDSQGAVLVEDSTFGISSGILGEQGASVVGCASVTFVRCQLLGRHVFFPFAASTSRPGLTVTDSDLHLYDCFVRGGNGNPASSLSSLYPHGEPGAPAFVVEDSFVFASGSMTQGGDGSNGVSDSFTGQCGNGGEGGAGLTILGATSQVGLLDTELVGGSGGASGVGVFGACALDGAPGPTYVNARGSLAFFPGTARSLDIESPVRGGGSANLAFAAPAGEVAFLLLSAAQDPVWKGAFLGVLVPDEPLLVLPAGVVGADGTLSTSLPVPDLGGIETLPFFGQAAFAGGAVRLGSPSVVVVLDPSL